MAPLEVRIPHTLSREEVHQRIDAAIVRAKSEYEPQVGPIQADWNDQEQMIVGLNVMGMPISGQIDVLDAEVLVKIELPSMASMFSGRIRQGIEERLGGLLAGPSA